MVDVPAGPFVMGAGADDSFAYDNELPAHEVFVPAFKHRPAARDQRASTRDFVDEGGYERREFWSEEGWGWREREGWEHPLYWRRDGRRLARAARCSSEGELLSPTTR